MWKLQTFHLTHVFGEILVTEVLLHHKQGKVHGWFRKNLLFVVRWWSCGLWTSRAGCGKKKCYQLRKGKVILLDASCRSQYVWISHALAVIFQLWAWLFQECGDSLWDRIVGRNKLARLSCHKLSVLTYSLWLYYPLTPINNDCFSFLWQRCEAIELANE